MFEWLIRNKEWIFSGIGVPVLAAVAAFLYRLARKRRTQVARAQAIGAHQHYTAASHKANDPSQVGRIASLPSGNEIALTVDHAPPFQREQVGANYVGLAVSWPVIFFRLFALGERLCVVTLAYGDETWGAKIDVKVDIGDYPRLKTIVEPDLTADSQDGCRLTHGWIEGRIVKCGFGGMTVAPTKLEFFN
jgi:hypothetical protein